MGVSAITGSFTLGNPLGANFNGFVVPLSYSFTDGVTTLTQLNTGIAGFTIATGAGGAIAEWDILMGDLVLNFGIFTTNCGSLLSCGVPYQNDTAGYSIPSGQAFNLNSPGTWSSSSPVVTPEPSSLILLGSGLLGVLGAARRRLRI